MWGVLSGCVSRWKCWKKGTNILLFKFSFPARLMSGLTWLHRISPHQPGRRAGQSPHQNFISILTLQFLPLRIQRTQSWYFNSQNRAGTTSRLTFSDGDVTRGQVSHFLQVNLMRSTMSQFLLVTSHQSALSLHSLSPPDDILMMRGRAGSPVMLQTLPYTKNTSAPAKTSSINPYYTFDTDRRNL